MNQPTELKLRVGISGQECGVFKLDPSYHGMKLGGKAYLFECVVVDTCLFSEPEEELRKLAAEGFVIGEPASNDSDEDTYYVCYNPASLIECEHHLGSRGSFHGKPMEEAVENGIQIDYFPDAEMQTYLHDKLGDGFKGVVELVEFLGNEKVSGWGYRSREQ